MLSLAAAVPAAAGNFSVAPVRIELSKGQPTAVMTVHNNDDAPLLVQASALAWSQPGGEDLTEPTRELLATPPIFTLAPNSDQIVRVALRREPDATRELAYRLLLAEVPQPATKDFTGLRVALRLSLPVFVQPKTGASPDVKWTATRTGTNALRVSATNLGTQHLQVTDFELRFPGSVDTVKASVTRYVLPGSTISWALTTPSGASAAAGAVVHGFSDSGEFSADIQVTGP
ncbi:MAG: fimbria/pilus periplasmic chaperone [Steroidobacteraceae bacterium]